jgi:hypothetical protein
VVSVCVREPAGAGLLVRLHRPLLGAAGELRADFHWVSGLRALTCWVVAQQL